MTSQELLALQLGKKITLKSSGKRMEFSQFYALHAKAIADALKGSPKQTLDLLRYMGELGVFSLLDDTAL